MRHWLITPHDGSEPHIAATPPLQHPRNYGYDEANARVVRQARPLGPTERMVDGQRSTCPAMAVRHDREVRVAEIGFDAWLAETIATAVQPLVDRIDALEARP